MLISPDRHRDGSSPRGGAKKPPGPVAFFIVHLFTVMSYCVYILYSQTTGRFYTGMTENLEQRIFQHNNPISELKYTAKEIPWQLYIALPCNDKQHAIKLEKFIKARKSSVFIRNLKKVPGAR